MKVGYFIALIPVVYGIAISILFYKFTEIMDVLKYWPQTPSYKAWACYANMIMGHKFAENNAGIIESLQAGTKMAVKH